TLAPGSYLLQIVMADPNRVTKPLNCSVTDDAGAAAGNPPLITGQAPVQGSSFPMTGAIGVAGSNDTVHLSCRAPAGTLSGVSATFVVIPVAWTQVAHFSNSVNGDGTVTPLLVSYDLAVPQ
ncbi:MAG TPA: hypothetical protein VND92_10905, partial [Vicinamibacterales bacterium]|nr:hypothetical protein [Vicinamibacterales bacterium]